MKENKIIMKVIDYIENNLESRISLDNIADKAGYSKFHLNRMFAEHVGCTVHKYIKMRRLTVAAEKLIFTESPIVDIAYEANYNSQQSFTFAFRQVYESAPQEYREMKIYYPKLERFDNNGKLTITGKLTNVHKLTNTSRYMLLSSYTKVNEVMAA